MKKVLSLAMLCTLALGSLVAQTAYVTSSNFNQLKVKLATSQFVIDKTVVDADTFATVSMRDYMPSGEVGKPCLPIMVKMIEIPLCQNISVSYRVLHADTLDASTLGINHMVMPAQPSRSKSDRSPVRMVKDMVTYNTNAFYGSELVSVEKVGVARDRNLASLTFSPIQYNPVTNQMIICKDVEATISYIGADLSATMQMKQLHSNGAFNAGVATLNSLPAPKAVRTSAPIVYQIVAHSMFRGELDSLIAWKQRKGYIVNVAYTDDANVGTTSTSIAAYLKGLYTNANAQNPAPTFVLFVGDNEQIPAFAGREGSSSHITDLYYATWTDGDIIPDCFYGRMSAKTVAQLTPQIEKTLFYERCAFPDLTFLEKAILVAGVDGGYTSDNAYRYCDPTMDYLAKTYFIPANGVNTVYYYKNNTNFAPTGVTVTGSSQSSASATALRNLYNEGSAWVNYSAHGDVGEWYQPNFSTSHVAAMTNNQKYGFMVGSCCLSASFQSNCLGEALLQKDNLAGAVGYYGGSDYTYWAEDFYWAVGVRNGVNNTCDPTYSANNLGAYDRFFHTHGEPYSEWYTSSGAINMAGCMAVQSSSSSLKNYYWEVYHLFGDPSVLPWIGVPGTINPSINPGTLFVGATTLSVTAVPYAYVALTDGNGHLIAAAFADAAGAATLNFDAIGTPGTYEVAISAQNYRTFFSDIQVIVPDGPYVMVTNIEASSNVIAGMNTSFNVTLENIGVETTQELSLELRTNGEHIYLTNGAGIQTINNSIAPDQSLTLTGFASGNVWGHVADQTSTPVTAIVRWGNHSDQRSTAVFNVMVKAPRIEVSNSSIEGTVETGQTVALHVTNTNTGHAAISNATASLMSPEPSVSVTNGSVSLGNISVNASSEATFNLQLAQNLPSNALVPLIQTVSNGNITAIDTVWFQIGQGSTEDFESGNFDSYDWVQSGNYPWVMTNNDPYSGSYCARSYNHANDQGHSTSSDLSISWTSSVDDSISFYLKVSSEESYDHFYFYIDNAEVYEASGENDWGRVAFPVSAGTHTFKFRYQKDYSVSRHDDCAYIDHIVFPLSGAARHYSVDTVCQGADYQFHSLTINTASLEAGTHYYQDSVGAHIYILALNVVETPTLTVTASPETIRQGECSLLTASGASRYVWNTGETVETFRVYPTETTTYTVTGYNGTCGAEASVTVTVDGSIGIEAVNAEMQLSLYPNPATDKINVRNISTAEPLVLMDVYGRQLNVWMPQSETMTISLADYPKGVYMLRNGNSVVKVVKK